MTTMSDLHLEQLQETVERLQAEIERNGRMRAEIEQLRSELRHEREILDDREVEVGRLRAEKDEAYRQRNHLVAALARLFPSGIRATNIEGWEPDWHGCVYIDLPTGQISYHYHDSQEALFAALPSYTKTWDGHDKEAVHARLHDLRLRPRWREGMIVRRALDGEKG